MRRIATLIVGLGLLALTACSGDAEPSPPPSPTPTVTTAVPTPSSSPTAPVMPEAAREHTEAGAKAFVEYLWALADALGRSPDPDPMRQILDEECSGCQGVLDLLADLQHGNGVLRDSRTSLSKFAVTKRDFGGEGFTEVAVDVASTPSVADYPGTDRDVQYPGGKRRTLFLLKFGSGRWRVTTWQPL